MAAVCAKVEAANKLQDPLEAFPVFKKYDRNGLNVSIECRRVSGLEPSTLDWAFELTKANMQTLYEQSEWGWKEREKREELRDERAWYLVAREAGAGPVAFSHFRFDVECGDEVLYCYEVQLESRVRRRGLGKFLLQILQLVANSTQMKKVMLTVFKHNHGAYQFFREALHGRGRAPRAGGAGAATEVRGGRHLPQRVRLLRGRLLLRDPEPQHQVRGPPLRGGALRRLLPLSPQKPPKKRPRGPRGTPRTGDRIRPPRLSWPGKGGRCGCQGIFARSFVPWLCFISGFLCTREINNEETLIKGSWCCGGRGLGWLC
ncbi:N-alpha-acetyltransferase 40 isoform X3 [Corvus moneduloides]|nr:N-alpha-acetyltransferase 40 isoform X3 [Corvus moneduloides]